MNKSTIKTMLKLAPPNAPTSEDGHLMPEKLFRRRLKKAWRSLSHLQKGRLKGKVSA